MGSTRRSFSDEYKKAAVDFVLTEGRPVKEVAGNIGVHEMTLGKWVKKERDAREASVPADAELSESERAELLGLWGEVRSLRSEKSQLEMQVDFAKKVATWSPTRWRWPLPSANLEQGSFFIATAGVRDGRSQAISLKK